MTQTHTSQQDPTNTPTNQSSGSQHTDPQNTDETTTPNTKQDTTQDTTQTMSEIDQLQADLQAMTDTAKRALADLQNVQKRATQERLELYPRAQADLMSEFLPVIDSFARAFSTIPEELQNNEWVKGVEGIETQFKGILNRVGLQPINPENADFDPNQHDAMLEVDGPKNKVIQVLETGYMFKDQVIRPAKVSVGRG